MNSIDRIYAAIEHKNTDKVPKGELGVADELAKCILGVDQIGPVEEIDFRKRLNMDMINRWCGGTSIHQISNDELGKEVFTDGWGNLHKPVLNEPEDIDRLVLPGMNEYGENIKIISYYREHSTLFVFGQTDGVLTPIYDRLFGWENCMVYSCTDIDKLSELAMMLAEHYAELAKLLIDAGAHGIIIADDIAFNTGTFLSEKTMREMVFPALKKEVILIKAYKDVPVFFHTDGDINKVMSDIVDCGFDGLQSLQPSANMDILKIKQEYGERICLMGNIDLNYILPFGTEEEVRKNVRETIEIGQEGGGYILSTCNILTKDVPAKNALAMYDEAEKFITK